MRNFRNTIKMMVMALVMGYALCSCCVSHLSPEEVLEPKNTGTAAPTVKTQETADNGIRPQAVLRDSQLTFYYDNKDHNTEGTVYEVSSKGYGVKGAPWASSGFISARFDESCKDWNPTSMVFFFSGCTKAVSIDCTNLNTSSVVDMSCMFQKCRSLASLDLTGFDTANVIEMYRMFNECGVLESIIVDSSFIQKADQTGSYEMYRLCPAQLING